MKAQDIIIKPILTEKGYDGIASKKYTFKVAKGANKTQIKMAVEELFGVKVASVNTCLLYTSVVERKLLPCYVFIKMIYSNQVWYLVTNTRGVTGFVGPQGRPLPLKEEEVRKMQLEKVAVNADFAVGDSVSIDAGPVSYTHLDVYKRQADIFYFLHPFRRRNLGRIFHNEKVLSLIHIL